MGPYLTIEQEREDMMSHLTLSPLRLQVPLALLALLLLLLAGISLLAWRMVQRRIKGE